MLSTEELVRIKAIFVFLSISLLFCMDIVAEGSMLDVKVSYEGKPAGQAYIYIDNNSTSVGQTSLEGTLDNINIDPGDHTVIATWRDSSGQERMGRKSLTILPESYTDLNIYLDHPRNLGWIWQFVASVYS